MNPSDLPIAPSAGKPSGLNIPNLQMFFPNLSEKKGSNIAPPTSNLLPKMTESKSNLLEGLSETYFIHF